METHSQGRRGNECGIYVTTKSIITKVEVSLNRLLWFCGILWAFFSNFDNNKSVDIRNEQCTLAKNFFLVAFLLMNDDRYTVALSEQKNNNDNCRRSGRFIRMRFQLNFCTHTLNWPQAIVIYPSLYVNSPNSNCVCCEFICELGFSLCFCNFLLIFFVVVRRLCNFIFHFVDFG